MGFGGRCMRRFQAGMDAGVPGVGLLAHRSPQLTLPQVARRITGQEVDVAFELRLEAFRAVTGAEHVLGGHHQIAVGVFDIDDALGADNADLQAVDRPRPDDGQGPGNIHGENSAVVHGEDTQRRVLGAEIRQGRVDRLGIDGSRRFAFHQPHAHVQAVGAGDNHRRQVVALVGFLNGGDRHHTVHEGAGDDRGDRADLSLAEAFLDGQEAPPETLGIADHGVGAGGFDGFHHLARVERVGGQRLFDEQMLVALFQGEQGRVDVFVFVGDDHHGVDLGAADQLFVVGGEKIGIDVSSQFFAQVFINVAQAQPADARIIAGHDGPDAADGAAADNGQADFHIIFLWHL